MPNQLNKDKNKIKEKDEIRIAQEILISAQQAKHRRKLQQIVDEHRRGDEAQTEGLHSPSRPRSAKQLLEETRQRLNLVEETREEFLNLYMPRVEHPNGREATRMAQSAEVA